MTDVLESSAAAGEVVADIPDEATVLIGGFGTAGRQRPQDHLPFPENVVAPSIHVDRVVVA